ncbi:MAG: PA3496 family putative envelope integrity protein [Gammaproteobacteria bacterium]
MNDTDDFELDDVDSSDEFNDVEENLPVKKVLSKRDVRTQIEDRLEQIELRKLLGDSGYDEVFD